MSVNIASRCELLLGDVISLFLEALLMEVISLCCSVHSLYENNCLQNAFLHLLKHHTKQEAVQPINEAASRIAAHITTVFSKACKVHKTSEIPRDDPVLKDSTEPFVRSDPNLFPCLLVCYGSGATFNLVRICVIVYTLVYYSNHVSVTLIVSLNILIF